MFAGEGADQGFVLGILPGEAGTIGEGEIGKIKTGGYGTANKGVFAALLQSGAEPVTGFYEALKGLIVVGVIAQQMTVKLSFCIDFIYYQRIAVIKMPELIGGNAVHGRELVFFQ